MDQGDRFGYKNHFTKYIQVDIYMLELKVISLDTINPEFGIHRQVWMRNK